LKEKKKGERMLTQSPQGKRGKTSAITTAPSFEKTCARGERKGKKKEGPT